MDHSLDLPEAINAIRDIVRDEDAGFQPKAILELNGRKFRWSPATNDYQEVTFHNQPPVDADEHADPITCGTVDALVKWVQASSGDAEVQISRIGTSQAKSPRRIDPWHRRDKATKPFFANYLPPAGWHGLLEFKAWMASLGEGLVNADTLELALNSVQASTTESIKIVTKGAFTSFVSEDEHGAKTAKTFPRVIAATIPFGDPGFSTLVEFRVTSLPPRQARLDPSVVAAFKVELHCPEPAYDAYVAWALDVVDKGLGKAVGEGVKVFVTP